jgi:hypothetical protein
MNSSMVSSACAMIDLIVLGAKSVLCRGTTTAGAFFLRDEDWHDFPFDGGCKSLLAREPTKVFWSLFLGV